MLSAIAQILRFAQDDTADGTIDGQPTTDS
jgi:hypothetical protein